MTLLEIAERCEKAPRAEMGIDADIERALGMTRRNSLDQEVFGNGESLRPRRYSGSLDAAMTLVPEGWRPTIDAASEEGATLVDVWALPIASPKPSRQHAKAATPALALCAAALRTRSTQEGDKG